jgi:hypothetical protein
MRLRLPTDSSDNVFKIHRTLRVTPAMAAGVTDLGSERLPCFDRSQRAEARKSGSLRKRHVALRWTFSRYNLQNPHDFIL